MSPSVSVIIPVHSVEGCDELLERNLLSLHAQSYWDWEAVVSDDSGDPLLKELAERYGARYHRNPGSPGMANNTNHAMDRARGGLLKILFMDDFFYDPESLADMVGGIGRSSMWSAAACTHTMDGVNCFNDHRPFYSHSENTIGSPSVTIFRREVDERFDPKYRWVLDLDLYRRIFARFGRPRLNYRVDVAIGIGRHQETQRIPDREKLREQAEMAAQQ